MVQRHPCRRSLAGAMFITSLGTSTAYATSQLFTHGSYLFDSEPAYASAMSDFDNDGHMDLVIVGEGTYGVPGTARLEVHLGDGSGGFMTLPASFIQNDSSNLSVADFDRDGNLDLAAGYYEPYLFTVFRGDGLGAFDGGISYPVNGGFLGAGDLDGDAILDVIVRLEGGLYDALQIYRGLPAGGFELGQRLDGGRNPAGIVLADWNEDGIVDLAVTQIVSSVLVFLGNGDGTLADPTSFATNYNFGSTITAPDLDGDGHRDLVVAAKDWHHQTGGISVLFGSGNGSFPQSVFLPEDASQVATGDLDGDGLEDLLYMRNWSGEFAVRHHQAPRLFALETRIASGADALNVFLIDVEGDGDLDVVSPGYSNPVTAITPGNGDATFGSHAVIDPAAPPEGLVSADFDGDDHVDLATTGPGNAIGIFLGNGDLSFQPRSNFPVPVATSNLLPVDLDLDGDLDLVGQISNGVVALANAGDGTFGPSTQYTTGPTIQDFAIGDLDDDTFPDLVTANAGTSPGLPVVYFGFGNGTTTFQFAGLLPLAAGNAPRAIALHDLDHDGRDDLVLGFDNEIQVRRRVAAYDFAAPVSTALPSTLTTMLTLDFDADGELDVVAGGSTSTVLFGNGDASFDAAAPLEIAADTRTLVVADFDRDGRQDIATRNYTYIHIWLQEDSGTFGSSSRYGTGGTNPLLLAPADFDGDGKPDLACTNEYLIGLTLLRNLGGAPVDASIPDQHAFTGLRLRPARERADGSVDVRFDLSTPAASARLAVYDVRGRLVRALLHAPVSAGSHQVDWDRRGQNGTRVPRGVYFVELRADGTRTAHRAVLVRP